jgi:TPR repeat protein
MAVRWYRKAAEQGYQSAESNLAFMYHEGIGVSQNYDEALLLYRRAAEQGNILAQRSLANILRIGKEVPHDYAEAAHWYRKAADQGDAYSQTKLATMYYGGQGVERDYTEAGRWYSKAAAQGDADAQYALGSMYQMGQGRPQDYAEAVSWYRKAAARGHANARYALESMGAGTNTWRRIRYVYLGLALVGGLLLSSQFVSRAKDIHGWPRKAEALLGTLGTLYAGMSLYGIDHTSTQYSACFTSVKNLLGGSVVGVFVTLCLAGWLTGAFWRSGDGKSGDERA